MQNKNLSHKIMCLYMYKHIKLSLYMYIYISLQGLVWGKGRVKNNLVVLQHIAQPLRRELIVTLCFHQK